MLGNPDATTPRWILVIRAIISHVITTRKKKAFINFKKKNIYSIFCCRATVNCLQIEECFRMY